MRRKLLYVVFATLMLLAFVLTACKTTEVAEPEETTVDETIGTEANPIKVLFVPSTDANVIVTGGQILADALHEATGLYFEVVVPTSYAATIEEMCASPANTMGFLPPAGYVLANQRCGVDVALKAIRRGSSVYWAQFLVLRERTDLVTVEDLDGLTWGYGDTGSASGYLIPLGILDQAGVEVSGEVTTGGHNQTALAVYNGEVDFGTTFYSPPDKPEGEPAWLQGEYPDIPDELIDSCAPEMVGEKTQLLCSGWEVLDARRNVVDTAPDIVQKVKILAISGAIPNDTLAFGPDFPDALRTQIVTELQAFSLTEDWASSLGSQDLYGWDGMEAAVDSEYDPMRAAVAAAGITVESVK